MAAMRRVALACPSLLAPLALLAAGARVAHAKVALRPLPQGVTPALLPYLERGELALIESHPNGRLRQITVMTVVNAPPKVTYGVVAAPEHYPQFVPNMARSEVTRRQGDVAIVEWEMEVPLNNLEGTNLYRFHPAAIDIEAISGDLPKGAWRWEIHPAPRDRSVVVAHVYTDVRRVSWIMRKLIERNKSAEHAAVLSASTVFMKSLKVRAEKLAGRGTGRRPDARGRRVAELAPLWGSPDGPRLDARALDPLLRRGYVSLVESFPDGRLRQASIVTYAHAPVDRMMAVANDPARYHEFMAGVRRSPVLNKEGRSVVYEMEVEVPLLNLNFTSRAVQTGPYSIRTRSIGGDLEDARFAWDLAAAGPRRTLVLHSLNSDARRTSWLLRRLIQREPYYEHGMNVATGLVIVRTVRGRAEGWL
jgi:ribosome-associated toxin RatA of RatAB toxin-antitoxin module